MPVCAKMIYWVRKILSMTKTHMSLDTLRVDAASAALVAGVSLVSILQASGRHFELLLWRARPNSQTTSSQCLTKRFH